ncbi:hypothetical protein [Chryseobacterium sp. ISL-6]|uniref:hypothetical protein n=1 Tax=Chryseobacterium sp. ISL-6 TaxID=2819143 RepID=UPI001BE6D71F|nr:hypothetical protein [Chryseobacterium sp. ISL-6]MBT2620579.1 hypothetical protein [Chryseobacterium sp. ISL-6]
MKKLFILFIILSSFLNAQELELINGDYTYTKISNVDKPKSEIYAMLKKQFSNSTQYTINKDDPQSGILSVTKSLALEHYSESETTIPSYEINIEIKDKQIIYKVNNIVFKDIFKGMTNTKNDYQNLLKRIVTSESKIKELGHKLKSEKKKRKKSDINNELDKENEKLSTLNTIKNNLINDFSTVIQ